MMMKMRRTYRSIGDKLEAKESLLPKDAAKRRSRLALSTLAIAFAFAGTALLLVYIRRGRVYDAASTTMHDAAEDELPLDYSLRVPEELVPEKLLHRFDAYVALHRRILAGDQSVPAQFVVASPSGQLCNRVRTIISALVIGIITDRAVLVDFNSGYYSSFGDLFNSPIVMETSEVPVHTMHKVRGRGMRSLGGLCGGEEVACGELSTWEDVSISISGACYIPRLLIENEPMRRLFEARLGSFEGAFSNLFDYFLRPSASVADGVSAFLQTHFQHRFVVGLHIRGGGDFTDRMTDSDLQNFLSCSNFVAESPAKQQRLHYFVAADTMETRMRLLALTNASVSFYGDFLISDTVPGCQAAAVELQLLRHAKALVLTPFSSFSEVAATAMTSPTRMIYALQQSRQDQQLPYQQVEVASGVCLRPVSTEPSLRELQEILLTASCKQSLPDTPPTS